MIHMHVEFKTNSRLFFIRIQDYFHLDFSNNNSEWWFQTNLNQLGQFNEIQGFSRLITWNRLNARLEKPWIGANEGQDFAYGPCLCQLTAKQNFDARINTLHLQHLRGPPWWRHTTHLFSCVRMTGRRGSRRAFGISRIPPFSMATTKDKTHSLSIGEICH